MSLWLLKPVFNGALFFVVREREKNLFQGCQRSFWQSSYHSMSNCSSSRNDLDFSPPLLQSSSKQKTPPHPTHSLICLSGAPLGGGSAWTERALPEDYRMRGGEMCDCECVYICVGGVYICVGWVWGGVGCMWYLGGGGCMQFFPKCCNCLQDWTVQGSNTHFPVY